MTEHENSGISENDPERACVTDGAKSTKGEDTKTTCDNSPEPERGEDVPDRQISSTYRNFEEETTIEKLERERICESRWLILSTFFTFGSMILYIFDIALDIRVIKRFSEDNHWWLALTLTFVIGPTLIINSFSFKWYLEEKDNTDKEPAPPLSKQDKLLRYSLHFVGLGPVIRYFEVIIFECYSRRQLLRLRKREIQEMRKLELDEMYNYENLYYDAHRDVTMLAVIKSFSQSAPQLILQIYILVIRGHYLSPSDTGSVSGFIELVSSITLSLLSFALGISSYQRALRLAVGAKKLSRSGQVVMFFWRLGMILSRVFALALFATQFKYWLITLLSVHWGVMTMWIIHQQTDFCSTNFNEPAYWKEYLYDMVMGVIHIFCFFTLKETGTLNRVIAFYIIIFFENCICVSLWYHYSDSNVWYHEAGISLVFLSFIFGLFMMLLYYGFFHPKGRNKYAQQLVVLLKRGSVSTSDGEAEKESLFGVCCASNSQNISQTSRDNTAPLEPNFGGQTSIFTIEDNVESKSSEIGGETSIFTIKNNVESKPSETGV